MNTKLSILDSIYDIEQTECTSGLDTVGSMIEATDKAYSIIRECKTYGDDVYDMFSIFQEADENMDPDQHGKKISDMNKDEKRAYREKHAFKEDTPFMTFLKFLPNLVMLIVRSIGNLFKKKPDRNGLQKAVDYIQKWSDDHKEEAGKILSELYESVTGKSAGSNIQILGIGVPVALITGIFLGGFKTVAKCRDAVINFFKRIFKGKKDASNIKFGLKLNIDKGKTYWTSDINFTGLETYINTLRKITTPLDNITKKLNESNPNPNEVSKAVEEYNSIMKELDSENLKNGIFTENNKMEEITMSSEDLMKKLEDLRTAFGVDSEGNGIKGGLYQTLLDHTKEGTGSLGSAVKNNKETLSADNFKNIKVEDIIQSTKDMTGTINAITLVLSSMIDHINDATSAFKDGNFFEKILAKLRGDENSDHTSIISKLAGWIGGKRMALAEGNEKYESQSESIEDTTKTYTVDGTTYEECNIPNDIDLKQKGEDVLNQLKERGISFIDKENKIKDYAELEVAASTYNETTGDGDFNIEKFLTDNELTPVKKAEQKEPPEEPEETIQQNSFVDSIDEDSSVYAEQVTNKWYSL